MGRAWPDEWKTWHHTQGICLTDTANGIQLLPLIRRGPREITLCVFNSVLTVLAVKRPKGDHPILQGHSEAIGQKNN
jgi:hypothetical protein